jgi:signal transduction histidine kinase
LVVLSMKLRLARRQAQDQPELAALLDEASAELQASLDELRELARGIHPAVLTDRGLGPALEMLANRAPVAVEIAGDVPGDLPAPVAAAFYFVASEALANIAKYASAERAVVTIDCGADRMVVEIADDGVGGADVASGSGLRGLADRVAALDGRLDVHSPAGAGTRLRAEIPLRSGPSDEPAAWLAHRARRFAASPGAHEPV